MPWRELATAPKEDGSTLKVRNQGQEPEDYYVRFWSRERLDKNKWHELEEGFYLYNAEDDEETVARVVPDFWFDP